MERLVPQATAEPAIPASGGSSALRSTLYTLLLVMLAVGGWVKFNDQIAAISPSLAVPAGIAADQASQTGATQELMQIGLLPSSQNKAAIAAMGLPDQDAMALSDELRRGRLRLAQLPLIDDSPVLQGAGHQVVISSGGYTRQLLLTRQPVVVTLPIAAAGTISFRTPESGGVVILAETVAGPARLPDLQPGQIFSVGVIAQ
jgi:hypothetical protein